jgi:hypothetical protein
VYLERDGLPLVSGSSGAALGLTPGAKLLCHVVFPRHKMRPPIRSFLSKRGGL